MNPSNRPAPSFGGGEPPEPWWMPFVAVGLLIACLVLTGFIVSLI